MTRSSKANPKAGAQTVTSADGTRIAYETKGAGPPVILIGGAFNDRNSPIAGLPMAELLADEFLAIAYDRRGRGDSGDTTPYAAAREVEDIAALIDLAGEPAHLFGHSSGGGLALEAAAAQVPLRSVAVYEPPYSIDAAGDAESKAFDDGLRSLLARGRNDDAAAFFLRGIGTPDFVVESMRASEHWAMLTAMAPTLVYEDAVMSVGGSSIVPAARLGRITVPVLAMAGSASGPTMVEPARRIAAAAQSGVYFEFEGQDHRVAADIVAPKLKAFFGEGSERARTRRALAR